MRNHIQCGKWKVECGVADDAEGESGVWSEECGVAESYPIRNSKCVMRNRVLRRTPQLRAERVTSLSVKRTTSLRSNFTCHRQTSLGISPSLTQASLAIHGDGYRQFTVALPPIHALWRNSLNKTFQFTLYTIFYKNFLTFYLRLFDFFSAM